VTENLRVRSATELVDAAVQLLRHNFKAILTVSGIGMAPYIVLRPLLATFTGPDAEMMGSGGFFWTMLLSFIAILWFSLAGAAIIAAAAQAYRGETVDVGAAFGEVFARPGAILYGAIVKGLAIFLGALLLLVGALYFYATYFAVPTTIVVEKLSGGQGVERSRQLAAGYRWHALKPLALVWLLYWLISVAAGVIAVMLFGSDNPVLIDIFSTVVGIFVYPIISITEMLVYFDIRIRKEGYDVEMMASQLDPQVT
jgi:hypothetical protein